MLKWPKNQGKRGIFSHRLNGFNRFCDKIRCDVEEGLRLIMAQKDSRPRHGGVNMKLPTLRGVVGSTDASDNRTYRIKVA